MTNKKTFLGVFAILVFAIFGLSKPAESLEGVPDAVDDSIVMNEDSGPVTINWIANDDMDDNAVLDDFDATSTNGGSVTDNGDGTFDYNPVLDYSGGDGFTYTICDDDTPTPQCDTASVSITVIATPVCVSGFYQTLSGEINILDTTTTPASYEAVAPDIGDLNATGFNPNDGLIYGYKGNTQMIISYNIHTGEFTDLFSHTEDAPFAGDFDDSNNLYYNLSNSTTMWIYNTVTNTRSSITLPSNHISADIAYIPANDLFYGVQNGGDNLSIIDVSVPTVSTLALSGPIVAETGTFGAVWVTDNTNLFAFSNSNGNIYNINVNTGLSTLIATSSSNGLNDGMSCAGATSPFDISSILDYGDAPDSYGTLLASSGASAVVNTSYRLGNYVEVDADGQPSANALADDQDGIGDDEDGVLIGINSLTGQTIYESIDNEVSIKVPLNNGYVSMWIDHDNNGTFDVGEQVAIDVAPASGEANITVNLADTTSVPFDTYARVRLSARTGAPATGLYSFGEIEDYAITINPSPPTITNDALDPVTSINDGAYNITGVCSDDGDDVNVSVTDGTDTVNATSTTCSGGTFSVTVNITSLDDGTITVTSTIDDGINDPVSDTDNINKDATLPTINQSTQPNITAANVATYPINGTCTNNGDNITVTLSDSDAPANTVIDTTTCTSGTYSVTVDASSLIDGPVNVESVIDDGENPTVSDEEDINMDTGLPTIDQNPIPAINIINAATYPVSGTCSAVGDAISVTATDSDSPANTSSQNTTCQIGGTYSVILSLNGLISGNVNVESTINDGVNPEVSDDEDTAMPVNLDDDDTPSDEENGGPNGGDGNDDGIPDYLQDRVTTKINPIVGDYITIESTGDCGEFNAVNFYREDELATLDDNYSYDIGLHGFQITCLSQGDTANITYYWDQVYDTDNWIYRKYIDNQYVDFSDQVTYGTDNIGGKNVTTVSFSITDGGEFDDDGIANGVIVDPAGPAEVLGVSTDTPSAPNTGLSKTNLAKEIAFGLAGLILIIISASTRRKLMTSEAKQK